jgi:hypothetical protein
MTAPAMTIYDIVAMLVDNSTVSGDQKYRLNQAINALADEAGVTVSPTLPVVPLGVTTTTLAAGSPGVAYSQNLAADGGVSPVTWVAAGLPAGLSANNSGVITGTPTVTGTFAVTAIATDSSVPAQTAVVTLDLVVA